MVRIALRLLLAVCLVLNGIGTAMAAVSMPGMVGGASHALMVMPISGGASPTNMVMPDSDPQAATTCEHVELIAVAEAASFDTAPSKSHTADCDLDCCAQGACSCPCVQLAQAGLPAFQLSTAPSGRSRGVAALDLGHATPLLLNLIRPPIG